MSTVAEFPTLFSCGHELDEDYIGWMRELPANPDPELLRARMDQDGYLLLRSVLDPAKVIAARRRVLELLAADGQLEPGTDIMDAIPRQGLRFFFKPEVAQKNNPELQELLYAEDGELMQWFGAFLGGEVRHYDFTWLRAITPGPGTPSHCDIVYMGRGTRRVYTTWIPLGPANLTTGGLTVLENSHRNERLQKTYGSRDVDSYCTNRPDDPARTSNGLNGWLTPDSNKVRRQLGNRWLVAEYQPGDMVVFCMDLVHGGLDNRSNHVRLSSDSRYQLASEPIDDRWIGDEPIGTSSAGKRGRIC